MRKFISICIALLLMVSLAVSVSAAEGTPLGYACFRATRFSGSEGVSGMAPRRARVSLIFS